MTGAVLWTLCFVSLTSYLKIDYFWPVFMTGVRALYSCWKKAVFLNRQLRFRVRVRVRARVRVTDNNRWILS